MAARREVMQADALVAHTGEAMLKLVRSSSASVLRRGVSIALLAAGFAGCASPEPAPASVDPQARAVLAPTGVLRVGVYSGSPTSMVRSASGETRGLAVEIGQSLARRLGVPVEIVVFERVALVVDAIAAARVDMTITNASPARAEVVDFSPALLALELGVIVMPGSPVASVDGLDRDGIRVGVTQGSTSQGALAKRLTRASLVPAPSPLAAQAMLRSGAVDAYATNKAILFELGDALPGARVLDGRWGLEHLAIAVPKGRGQGPFLAAFADEVRRDGEVERAVQRAGLRGTAPADAR
jgi:polar amino acid transport system substrate-binding protein